MNASNSSSNSSSSVERRGRKRKKYSLDKRTAFRLLNQKIREHERQVTQLEIKLKHLLSSSGPPSATDRESRRDLDDAKSKLLQTQALLKQLLTQKKLLKNAFRSSDDDDDEWSSSLDADASLSEHGADASTAQTTQKPAPPTTTTSAAATTTTTTATTTTTTTTTATTATAASSTGGTVFRAEELFDYRASALDFRRLSAASVVPDERPQWPIVTPNNEPVTASYHQLVNTNEIRQSDLTFVTVRFAKPRDDAAKKRKVT